MYDVVPAARIKRNNGESEGSADAQTKTHIVSESLRCGEVRVKILDDLGWEIFKIESPQGAMPIEGNGISRELQILEVSDETEYHDLIKEMEWLESEIDQLSALAQNLEANQQTKKTNKQIYTLLQRDILNRRKRIAQLKIKVNSIARIVATVRAAKDDAGKVTGIRGELMPNTTDSETFEALNAEDFVIGYGEKAAIKKLPGRPINREILGIKGEKLDVKNRENGVLLARVYLSFQTRQIDDHDMAFLTPHTIGGSNNLKFVFTDSATETSTDQAVSNAGNDAIPVLYSVSEWTNQVERLFKSPAPVISATSSQTEPPVSRFFADQGRETVTVNSPLFAAAQRFLEQTKPDYATSADFVQQSLRLDREGRAVLAVSLDRATAQRLFGIGEAGKLVTSGFRSMTINGGQAAIHYDSDEGASSPKIFRNESKSSGSIKIETVREGQRALVRTADFVLTRPKGKHDHYSLMLSGPAEALENILRLTPF